MRARQLVCAILFLAGLPAHADDQGFSFHLPSFVSVEGGGGSDGSRSGSLMANLSLKNNFQLFARAGKSTVEIEDDKIDFTQALVGVGTDPLNELSFSLTVDSNSSGSESKQVALKGDIVWAPSSWLITLSPRAMSLKTDNRETFLNRTTAYELKSSSLAVALEHFLSKAISLRALGAVYSYDGDLEFFRRPLAELTLPIATQLLVFSYPANEYGAGATLSLKKWLFGLDTIWSKAMIDSEENFSASLSVGYTFNRKWNANFVISRSESPELESTDSEFYSGRAGLTFSWDR